MAYLSGVAVNFMLTPLAATAAFTPAIGELGAAMNMTPLPVFYSFGYGIDQYILPYEAVYFLYIFITGKVTLRHVIPALAVRAALRRHSGLCCHPVVEVRRHHVRKRRTELFPKRSGQLSPVEYREKLAASMYATVFFVEH